MSFPPIQSFDPGNMTPDSDGRRAVPPERSSHRPGRQSHPYSRNSAATGSTISRTNSESQTSEIPLFDDLDSVQGGSESRRRGKQPEVPKLDFTRYTAQERITIDWMRKKVEMDMLTIKGWESLVTDEEKSAAKMYVTEIVGQANQKHHCGMSSLTLNLCIVPSVTDITTRYFVHGCLGRLSDAFADGVSCGVCRRIRAFRVQVWYQAVRRSSVTSPCPSRIHESSSNSTP
jgi:hypothetical protein